MLTENDGVVRHPPVLRAGMRVCAAVMCATEGCEFPATWRARLKGDVDEAEQSVVLAVCAACAVYVIRLGGVARQIRVKES